MKQGAPIRFLLVAFPVGLVLIGAGSIYMSHLRPGRTQVDPNESVRLEAASLNRKPVDREHLERSLSVLTETIGERHVGVPARLEQAAVWIESTLGGGNLGYTVERQEYDADGDTVRNLVAELPGTTRRDEIVVVGAHYDTVPGCPGANDNGTGIAALLAIARAMAGDPQDRTVRFVAFVNEEPPFFHTELMGSRVNAMRSRQRLEKIVAMMAFDTIGFYSEEEGSQETPPGLEGGFPTAGNFLAFVGDEASRYLADSARMAFTAKSGILGIAGAFPPEVPGVTWSDHWSFWQEGYPAVMVTDTAPYRYPHYHQPSDTMDQLDLDRLVEVVSGLEASVRAWATVE